MPLKIQFSKDIWRGGCLPQKAIITHRNIHSLTVQCPRCTYLSVAFHELNGISLISKHLHQAFSYYTKWSVCLCLCVCVFVHPLCGALANGISLIRSIKSFYFLDFFFSSLPRHNSFRRRRFHCRHTSGCSRRVKTEWPQSVWMIMLIC